jgi:hypothetical protein
VLAWLKPAVPGSRDALPGDLGRKPGTAEDTPRPAHRETAAGAPAMPPPFGHGSTADEAAADLREAVLMVLEDDGVPAELVHSLDLQVG